MLSPLVNHSLHQLPKLPSPPPSSSINGERTIFFSIIFSSPSVRETPFHHLHLFSLDKGSPAIIYIDTISSFLCARHHHHHVFFLAVCSVSARLQLLLLLPSSSSRVAICFGLCLLFLSMQLRFYLLLTVSLFHVWTVAAVLVVAAVQLHSLLSPLLCVDQLVRIGTGRQEQLFLLPRPSSPANSFSSPFRELCIRKGLLGSVFVDWFGVGCFTSWLILLVKSWDVNNVELY